MLELAIGIDIGGTFTKYGFIDRKGDLYAEGVIPTDKYDNIENYLDALGAAIKQSENHIQAEYTIAGIGVGAPNGNYYKGTIENPPNLKWNEGIVPFADLLGKYYNVPIRLTNDANAAALGEMIYGGAKGMRDFIMITLGTGLGSGIVANGELIYGHDGFAGELGHINVRSDGRKCGCGNSGCLETYASATGIRRTVFELIAYDPVESVLADISFNELTSELIYDAAKRNDPVALNAFEITGQILGKKLADSIAHTSPEAIFLFGGLARSGDLIFKPTKKYMEESLLYNYKNKVKLLPSDLMDKNAAILGSGALIWKDL